MVWRSEMNGVLKLMNDDHQKLEKLFVKLHSAIETRDPKAAILFKEFKQILQKHFVWEEKTLFPLFEKRTGLSGVDTIFILRNEHHQINKMFILKIDVLISDQRYKEILPLLTGLGEMLTMHRKMETDIFYPWFDESLEQDEKNHVIEKLKEK
jgi:iron-sulfur cluster repair protein YtfE (RIC family)